MEVIRTDVAIIGVGFLGAILIRLATLAASSMSAESSSDS